MNYYITFFAVLIGFPLHLAGQCLGEISNTMYNSMHTGDVAGQAFVATCNSTVNTVTIQSNSSEMSVDNVTLRIWEEQSSLMGKQVSYIQPNITLNGMATPTAININNAALQLGYTYYFEFTQTEGESLDLHYKSGESIVTGFAFEDNFAPLDGQLLTDLYIIVDATLDLLPIELLSFDVHPTPLGVQLNWETTLEQDNKGFEILHTTNAREWKPIGFVDGQVHANSSTTYSFVDDTPATGLNYYRLRQIDLDGTYTDFPIRSVTYHHASPGQAASVFPNPTQDVLHLQFPQAADRQLRLSTSKGQTVWKSVLTTETSTSLSWRDMDLEPGLYFLYVREVSTNTSISPIKVILSN